MKTSFAVACLLNSAYALRFHSHDELNKDEDAALLKEAAYDTGIIPKENKSFLTPAPCLQIDTLDVGFVAKCRFEGNMPFKTFLKLRLLFPLWKMCLT